jgi:hypothetical protein
MQNVKPKNSLKTKLSVSSLVQIIVSKIKEDFKNIDFDTIRNDANAILYLMELVEACLSDSTIIDPKTAQKLSKTDLVLQIVKILFPSITPTELTDIQSKIEFILENNLVKSVTSTSFFSTATKALNSCITYVTGSKKQ